MTDRRMPTDEAVTRLYAAARGRPPGYRPQHARGRIFRGAFTPSGELAGLTHAAHLANEPSEVLVRFSNGSSDPRTPDTERGIRGIAVRFVAAGHDLVASNLTAFVSRRPEGFVELAELLAQSADGGSKIGTAARFMGFFAKHPESGPAMRSFGKLRAPASFTTTRYDGIHAYWLVGQDGGRTAFRFRFEPTDGEVALSKDEAAARDPQFLFDELEERITRRAARLALVFQLGESGDPTNDPTKRWPDSRRTVTVGTLEVTGVAPEADALEQEVFDPTRVADGIDPSDDPVLHFRGEVYRLSAERRRAGG